MLIIIANTEKKSNCIYSLVEKKIFFIHLITSIWFFLALFSSVPKVFVCLFFSIQINNNNEYPGHLSLSRAKVQYKVD